MRTLVGLVILVLVAGIGCGDNAFPKKDRQDEAVKLVWTDVYGMTAAAPEIDWVEGAELNCADGRGFQTVIGCKGGLSWSNSNVVQLAWFEGLALHQTDMAHEFCHLRSMKLTGDGDADHVGPCWREAGDDVSQPYSDGRGIVGKANAALAGRAM